MHHFGFNWIHKYFLKPPIIPYFFFLVQCPLNFPPHLQDCFGKNFGCYFCHVPSDRYSAMIQYITLCIHFLNKKAVHLFIDQFNSTYCFVVQILSYLTNLIFFFVCIVNGFVLIIFFPCLAHLPCHQFEESVMSVHK